MTDERDWRESNAPQWAKESAQTEIDQWRLTAALSWPTEPRPAPLAFRWVEYDRLIGEPEPGIYWDARCHQFELKKNEGEVCSTWKTWIFRSSSGKWIIAPYRGPLFGNERDARLWGVWEKCEEYATSLMRMKGKL